MSKNSNKAAGASGSGGCEIIIDCQDKFSEIFTSGKREYVETVVNAVAVGKPKWRHD